MNHFSNSTRKSLGNKKSQQNTHTHDGDPEEETNSNFNFNKSKFRGQKKYVRLDKISANNVKEKRFEPEIYILDFSRQSPIMKKIPCNN